MYLSDKGSGTTAIGAVPYIDDRGDLLRAYHATGAFDAGSVVGFVTSPVGLVVTAGALYYLLKKRRK